MKKTAETQDTVLWWWGPGFYDRPVENGIEITAEYHDELLRGQVNGYEITSDANGYPVLTEPGPKTLDEWRDAKLADIADYDGSDQVNRFYLADASAWFDKATRNGLRGTLDAEESAGKTATVLWIGSQPPRAVEMPIADARKMLADIEVYSKAVFDVTQRHRAAVYALDTIDDLRNYDHTVGYPPKLTFK